VDLYFLEMLFKDLNQLLFCGGELLVEERVHGFSENWVLIYCNIDKQK
jgi:hypothetical protein